MVPEFLVVEEEGQMIKDLGAVLSVASQQEWIEKALTKDPTVNGGQGREFGEIEDSAVEDEFLLVVIFENRAGERRGFVNRRLDEAVEGLENAQEPLKTVKLHVSCDPSRGRVGRREKSGSLLEELDDLATVKEFITFRLLEEPVDKGRKRDVLATLWFGLDEVSLGAVEKKDLGELIDGSLGSLDGADRRVISVGDLEGGDESVEDLKDVEVNDSSLVSDNTLDVMDGLRRSKTLVRVGVSSKTVEALEEGFHVSWDRFLTSTSSRRRGS